MNFLFVAMSCLILAMSCLILVMSFLILLMRFLILPMSLSPRRPKDDPKTAQDAPKMPPRHPKTRPRRLQDILVRTQEGPKHPQGTSKTPRQAPRASQLRPDLEFGPHGQRIWTMVSGCLRKIKDRRHAHLRHLAISSFGLHMLGSFEHIHLRLARRNARSDSIIQLSITPSDFGP